MNLKFNLLSTYWLVVVCSLVYPTLVHSQRSLLHWKRDLEYRLNSYQNQRETINTILSSSIYPTRRSINGTAIVSSGGNVRFSDLVIPTGSLVLDSRIAQPTVRLMVNKAQHYVSSKMNELFQIRTQLDTIKLQMDEPKQQSRFIYKGLPNTITPQINNSIIIGTRIFKQFMYGHVIDSENVELRQVNFTSVDRVLDDTYMDNPLFGSVDSQSRLFFEGRKTFWKTVFVKQLKSGCCDRLKPLHTNHMMTRSTKQVIRAPILFSMNDQYNREPVVIRQLATGQLYNRILALGWDNKRPDDNGLIRSPPENFVHLQNLVNIRQPNQPDILKTLVFKDVLMVDEAKLSNHYSDNRLTIGLPGLRFDLSHDNYLLKFLSSRANTTTNMFQQQQTVTGSVVVNSQTHLLESIDAGAVNRVPNFNEFVTRGIVRIDRPAIIRGTVQFNALPSMFNHPMMGPSRSPQNVLIMRVNKGLGVGLVNGMRLPQDIVILPPFNGALPPNALIRVQGSRHFSNQAIFKDLVQVRRLINNIQMPEGVIPLHLNDFMSSVGKSNLWFTDGIVANHITVQSGQFDDIVLRDVYGDAQSLVMRSALSDVQPDGSQLIRAPLRVMNLKLVGQTANQGMLNGFKPQDVLELAKQPIDTIYGKKTFLAPVEVADCVFNDINHLANWTNYLIRIDRPNTVQTIHTKLAFTQPTSSSVQPSSVLYGPSSSSVQIDNFRVDFYPNNNPIHYRNNLDFSPEFYILHQALIRGVANHTEGRYRVLDRVRLFAPNGAQSRVNGIDLNDIVTLDQPFRFADRYVMVGKVEVKDTLRAGRITSNYPIDAMDLVQFDKYRIPIIGSRAPIRLNNLVLSTDNKASFIKCNMLNGISFNEFANSIMSLTRPQIVDSSLVFSAPVNLEGLVRTESSLNGVKQFKQFANNLKSAKYSFEDGLQCNTVMIKV